MAVAARLVGKLLGALRLSQRTARVTGGSLWSRPYGISCTRISAAGIPIAA